MIKVVLRGGRTSGSPLRLLFVFMLLATTACALPGLDSRNAPGPDPVRNHTAEFSSDAHTAMPEGQPQATDLPAYVLTPPHTIALPFVANDPSQPEPRPTSSKSGGLPLPGQPTGIAVPNRTEPVVLTLVLSSVMSSPPGILPRVEVMQSGGGNGSGEADCEDRPASPHWCKAVDGAQIYLTQGYHDVACGLDSQPLSAIVTLPDGDSRPASITAQATGCYLVDFLPGPGAPLGEYQVTLSQGPRKLRDTFQLVQPSLLHGANFNNCAWLAGLPLGQPVKLLVFGLVPPDTENPGSDPDLVTWRFLIETRLSAQVSRSALVCPDDAGLARYPELVFLAVPPSGNPVSMGDEEILRQFQGDCAGGPPDRLFGAVRTRILSANLPLFPDPGLSESPLAALVKGTLLTVRAGPVCPPGGPWTWQVQTPDGQTGWLAESDHAGYFLEPFP